MSKALVVRYNTWYQGIVNMRNYYESYVEQQALKLATSLFPDFYCIPCKFSFGHATAKNREADIILVSKKFNKWVIIEVELSTKKSLKHTFDQLEVFTSPIFTSGALANDLIRKNKNLLLYKSQLINLFTNKAPEVTVLLDHLNEKVKNKIISRFPIVSVCALEIYKEFDGDYNMYLVKGEYPHLTISWAMLTPINPQHFQVSDIRVFQPLSQKVVFLKAEKFDGDLRATLMPDSGKLILKLVDHPFDQGKSLKVERDFSGKYHIKYL